MISEIYQGDFRPVDKIGVSQEYIEKRQAVFRLSESYQNQLSASDKGQFEKVTEAHLELLVATSKEQYIAGFRDGARLMVEIMTDCQT